MKLFLSWSGDLSHEVAVAFRDWIPQVLNKVRPYVSSEDIDKGERWASDIAKELEASSFGMIIVTHGNLNAPWINFEAGALSKTVDRSQVAPFLFGLKRSEVVGPLLQFQSVVDDEADIAKLVSAINHRLNDEDKRSEPQLTTAFSVWYPHLRKALDQIRSKIADETAPEPTEQRKPTALLEEVLDIVRNQQKLLRTPELLLPEQYLRSITKSGRRSPEALKLHNIIREAESFVRQNKGVLPSNLVELVDRLHDQYHELVDGHVRRRRHMSPPMELTAPLEDVNKVKPDSLSLKSLP